LAAPLAELHDERVEIPTGTLPSTKCPFASVSAVTSGLPVTLLPHWSHDAPVVIAWTGAVVMYTMTL
jgi:hypothetical protein